jgi:hemerythrin-like domain-containing protein
MRATEILNAEHRVIEQVLACLETLADSASASGSLDRPSIIQALEFVTSFADGCHHAKEENHLFPAMERRGFSRHAGPIAVMLADHEAGRECVRQMRAAVNDPGPGGAAPFADAARRYVRMLREHIAKEDHCLFPMADQCLMEADQVALQAAFEEVEQAPGRADTHERMLALAQSLAERLGVPATAAAGAGRCCGH